MLGDAVTCNTFVIVCMESADTIVDWTGRVCRRRPDDVISKYQKRAVALSVDALDIGHYSMYVSQSGTTVVSRTLKQLGVYIAKIRYTCSL